MINKEERKTQMSYQQHDDLKNIPLLAKLAPVEAEKFMAFNHAIERDGAVIPAYYRELIAIAVALTTQCAYCIDVHTRNAKAHGVTAEALAEVAFIAAAMRAGGSLGHGLMALRLFEEAKI